MELSFARIGNFKHTAVKYLLVTSIEPEPSPSDGDLIASAAAGEREAFVAIYERHHGGIYRFARSMTGSTALAEDVTQDVFVALIRELKRYDPERGALRTYLYAIARNVSRHKLRQQRRFVGIDVALGKEPRATDDPARAAMQSQVVTRVRGLIKGLSSRYREVLILCDLQGLSYEEASAALSTPIGTVRSRLHRARKQLADRLVQPDRGKTPLTQGARKCLI